MNLTCTSAILLAGVLLAASQPTESPQERKPGFVAGPTDYESVVYADITSVTERDGKPYYPITLKIRCTLAGPYDAARFPVLTTSIVRRWQLGQPPLPAPPKVNAHVVVCLVSGRVPWYIPYYYPAPFMPDEWPILEVTGFDDPKVTDILSRMRKILATEPLKHWQAARQALVVERGNSQSPDGSELHTPYRVYDFIEDASKSAAGAKPSP
jgi:hypothetical protein